MIGDSYFFDTYAIIEVVKGNPNYSRFSEKTIVTSINNVVEVYYHYLKEFNEEMANEIINSIEFVLVDISINTAVKSCIFRYKYKKRKMSYIDCIGYVAAINNNLLFLTGDKEFEDLEGVEFVKK